MLISDWSSDACSSDLRSGEPGGLHSDDHPFGAVGAGLRRGHRRRRRGPPALDGAIPPAGVHRRGAANLRAPRHDGREPGAADLAAGATLRALDRRALPTLDGGKSEEQTSELQSLMRISNAVFCLKKKQ